MEEEAAAGLDELAEGGLEGFTDVDADVMKAMEKNALTLKWSLGFNKDIIGGLHCLSDSTRQAVFYAAAHTGIIYNIDTREQVLLQGHCNFIAATCVSSDRRWIVTADTGADSLLIVWDAKKGTPVKTIFNAEFDGMIALALSADSRYLATLSPTAPQVLSVWNWTADVDEPIASREVAARDLQTQIKFNPEDASEIVTNGERRVIFWRWKEGDDMHFYSPGLERELRSSVGAFTQSCFIPRSRQALSATRDGDVVLWGPAHPEDGYKDGDRIAIKMVKLHSSIISSLLILDQGPAHPLYIVTGSANGHVRFYDTQFRLVSWFENVATGIVNSIAFVPDDDEPEDVEPGQFSAPDFLVGTSTAIIMHVHVRSASDAERLGDESTLIFQGQDARVTAISAHPLHSIIAVSGHSGLLQIWDYEERAVTMARRFPNMMVECLEYSPSGARLVVGFANGAVLVLDSTLETVWSKPSPPPNRPTTPNSTARTNHHSSRMAVRLLAWASDDQRDHEIAEATTQHFASADADRCVAIYRKTTAPADDVSEGTASENAMMDLKETFVYVGKYRSHYKPIVGMQFGWGPDKRQRLLSLGEDRHIVEYDLDACSITGGIVIKNITKIMDVCVPCAFHWQEDDVLLVPNNEYKFMQYTADESIMCRKILLAPTYGQPLNKIALLPNGANPAWYMAYACPDKVIGLCKLPLDGNPNKSMGLIAHPGELTGLSVSRNGGYVCTAGGGDYTVNLFAVEPSALEITAALGGDGVDPFAALIDGGKDGPFYEEIKNYFFYAQIRQQGEDTTEPRLVHDTTMHVDKVPKIMRALGFYPSEYEIANMINELRYAQYDITNKLVDTCDFEDLIKLYVNHRPVFAILDEQVEAAFDVLGAETVTGVLPQERILDALLDKGERMDPGELQECLEELVGSDKQLIDALLTNLSSVSFMTDMLRLGDDAASNVDEEG